MREAEKIRTTNEYIAHLEEQRLERLKSQHKNETHVMYTTAKAVRHHTLNQSLKQARAEIEQLTKQEDKLSKSRHRKKK
jgi:hypothetical protein